MGLLPYLSPLPLVCILHIRKHGGTAIADAHIREVCKILLDSKKYTLLYYNRYCITLCYNYIFFVYFFSLLGDAECVRANLDA